MRLPALSKEAAAIAREGSRGEGKGFRESGRQAHRPASWHPDQGQDLAAGDQQAIVRNTDQLKVDPKANAGRFGDSPIDGDGITEEGGFPVVDFGAHDDRVNLCLCDFLEAHPHSQRQKRARGFDEAKIGNIVHDTAGIGIEIHNTDFGGNPEAIRAFHPADNVLTNRLLKPIYSTF